MDVRTLQSTHKCYGLERAQTHLAKAKNPIESNNIPEAKEGGWHCKMALDKVCCKYPVRAHTTTITTRIKNEPPTTTTLKEYQVLEIGTPRINNNNNNKIQY